MVADKGYHSTHGRGDLVTGSVRVVSDGPLGGMLRFDHPDLGEAVVGASFPISTAIFPVRRQEGGINTGVAIHNLESSSELVRCDLMREGVLHDSVMIPLEANGQTSWSLNSAFTTADTSDFAGVVRCDAVGEGRSRPWAWKWTPAPVPSSPCRWCRLQRRRLRNSCRQWCPCIVWATWEEQATGASTAADRLDGRSFYLSTSVRATWSIYCTTHNLAC